MPEYAVAPLSSAPVTRNLFLTKLSLAFPPSSVSWSDLLSLSKHLGMLTHLSLAGWPIPTRTPNMKTASYASKMQAENAASATTLYSASDNDFDESTMILRRLSENTYCLRWLDLEGCASWLPALVWQGSRSDWSTAATEWEQRRGARGPDWRGSWRNVAYLNMAQEWTPRNPRFLNTAAFNGRMNERFYRLGPTHLQIVDDLVNSAAVRIVDRCDVCLAMRNGVGDSSCGVCNAYYDQETARAARWLEREADAWAVGRSVNLSRAGGGNTRCTFDFGWQKRETYTVYKHL